MDFKTVKGLISDISNKEDLLGLLSSSISVLSSSDKTFNNFMELIAEVRKNEGLGADLETYNVLYEQFQYLNDNERTFDNFMTFLQQLPIGNHEEVFANFEHLNDTERTFDNLCKFIHTYGTPEFISNILSKFQCLNVEDRTFDNLNQLMVRVSSDNQMILFNQFNCLNDKDTTFDNLLKLYETLDTKSIDPSVGITLDICFSILKPEYRTVENLKQLPKMAWTATALNSIPNLTMAQRGEFAKLKAERTNSKNEERQQSQHYKSQLEH